MLSPTYLAHPAIRFHHLPDGQPHVHETFCPRPHPHHRVIAICGKGGVGKTAFSAMAAHALLHRADTGRLLLIDADPAFGLAVALGIEVEKTIASVREELLCAASSASVAAELEMAHKLDYLVFEAMVETDDFAFLAMGRSRDLGCYCSVNDLLRDAVEILAADFDTILIDGEAGLEQINRQVVASLDDLIILTDGSARGQLTVDSIVDMARENKLVSDSHIHIVANRFDGDVADLQLSESAQGMFVGIIPPDETVATFDRAGRSLMGLPHHNPASHAVAHAIDRICLA